VERSDRGLTWRCFRAFSGSDSGTVPTLRDPIRDCTLLDPQTAQSALNNRLSINAPPTRFDLYLYNVIMWEVYTEPCMYGRLLFIVYMWLTCTLLNQMLYNQSTGPFVMYCGITKIYCRKAVGHVFTKPVQIEGTTRSPPSKLFFIVVHISAARRCECM